MNQTWAAPTVSAPLDASVAVPGSKSMTNRALVLAALASAHTTIRNPLRARDTDLMVSALAALGAAVGWDGTDLVVAPGPVRGSVAVDCGLAGTVMRFVPPVAALADGDVAFDGDPYARQRPMRPVLDALRQLGVEVVDDGRGTLPFVVRGKGASGGVRGGTVDLDASGSSQFMSGLLLTGSRYDEGLVVRNVGAALPSLPHVEMSAAMVAAAGVRVDRVDAQTWRVHPGVPRGGVVQIEPDVSNALPFAAAALATRGRVRVVGFPAESPYQPAGELVRLLTALGADVSSDGEALVVDGSAGVHGADLDLGLVGELTPVIAALACLADSPTVIRGVAHLRGHETDRLAALVKELGRLGADVHETEDGLAISPRPLTAGVFETYHDHRLATAAAVLGLAVPGVQVVDVATTAKTLPGFVDLWTEMLG